MSKETQIPEDIQEWIRKVSTKEYERAIGSQHFKRTCKDLVEKSMEALYTHLLSQGMIIQKDLVAGERNSDETSVSTIRSSSGNSIEQGKGIGERVNYVIEDGQYCGHCVNAPIVVQCESFEKMQQSVKELMLHWANDLIDMANHNNIEYVEQPIPIKSNSIE